MSNNPISSIHAKPLSSASDLFLRIKKTLIIIKLQVITSDNGTQPHVLLKKCQLLLFNKIGIYEVLQVNCDS